MTENRKPPPLPRPATPAMPSRPRTSVELIAQSLSSAGADARAFGAVELRKVRRELLARHERVAIARMAEAGDVTELVQHEDFDALSGARVADADRGELLIEDRAEVPSVLCREFCVFGRRCIELTDRAPFGVIVDSQFMIGEGVPPSKRCSNARSLRRVEVVGHAKGDAGLWLARCRARRQQEQHREAETLPHGAIETKKPSFVN